MDMVESIKDQLKIPVVFMTYMNPIFVYGTERFMKRAAECGICGVIVPDVPYEEKEDLAAFSDGAIVGSAIVRSAAEHGTDCVPYVKEYVKKMKVAVAEA